MKLRNYLNNKGIKISFFAKQLGIVYSTLFRYMTDERPVPKRIILAVKQLTDGKVDRIKDKNNKLKK